MPWSGSSFHKHNAHLSPAQSAHAAKIANHVLQSTGDEGEAIATANKLVKRDIGGPIPSAATVGPGSPGASWASMLANLSPDQLQALTMRAGSSPIGQLAGRFLQQKRMMPNVGGAAPQPQAAPVQVSYGLGQPMGAPPAAPGAPPTAAAPAAPLASGGPVHRQMGGMMSMSMMAPWWARREASEAERPEFYGGHTPGRADLVNKEPLAGSYVIPADVVAHYGEGNSLAGARAIQDALSSGPYGVPEHSVPVRGSEFSHMPRPPTDWPLQRAVQGQAAGGEVTGRVPAKVSDGEMVIPPAIVRRVGGGNLKRGWRVLDALVLHARKKNIDDLKHMKPPVKS